MNVVSAILPNHAKSSNHHIAAIITDSHGNRYSIMAPLYSALHSVPVGRYLAGAIVCAALPRHR
jgi:hypothetical protein